MKPFEEALNLLDSRKFKEAKEVLEDILMDNPKNVDALYNLGMCFTELGEPEKSIKTLDQCIKEDSNYSNAYVALGYAYAKLNKFEDAKKYSFKALKLSPNNSYALRNLGGIFGKQHDNSKAIDYLKRAYEINPNDPNTVYGLGFIYKEIGDLVNADKYLKKVVEMKAPSPLLGLAKDLLREIAEINFKAKGLRMDAVFYCLGALEYFANKSRKQIEKVAFEIALKGRSGLDVNNPDKKYTLYSMAGEFSGLHIVCYMYVGFQEIASEQNIGFDLSKEYALALEMFNKKDKREFNLN